MRNNYIQKTKQNFPEHNSHLNEESGEQEKLGDGTGEEEEKVTPVGRVTHKQMGGEKPSSPRVTQDAHRYPHRDSVLMRKDNTLPI